jgi:endo-1,4-beta-mannosidase
MLLEDGNWRLYQWVRIGDGEPSARRAEVVPNTAPIPPATMATIQEGKVHVAGRPLPIAGINYYPQAAPWTTFWPAYDPQQITVDLQRIRALGLNTVRIFLSYTDFGGTVVTAQRRAQLADFLGRADAAGLKVLVTLFDHHTDHHPATWAADARHLATLVPYFAEHPAILAWDLKNEPDRDYAYNTQPLVDEWLRFIARNVRRHDANHLITIGWSTPEAAVALSDEVDFVAYHYFDEPTAYQARIAALQSAVGTKPILLEEFTFSTWNSPFYPGHTELEQAHYYAAMLNAHQAVDSLGYLVWTLYDFDTVPLAEFRYPWQRGMQANMGLLRRDGTAKMAATLVNPKTPRNLTPLTVWQQFAKPFWGTLAGLLLLSLVLLRWRWQRPPHQSRS